MKPSRRLATCAALVLLAGCQSERAPQFASSQQTLGLIKVAQDAVVAELEAGFGTPSKLTAWTALPVDFGTFTGTVVESKGDHLSLELLPDSPLAFKGRVSAFRGAALVLASSDVSTQNLHVASYDVGLKSLSLVDSHGKGVDVKVAPGEKVSVVGDTLQFGRDLYLRHCMHCHGVSGDGDGPTAKYFAVKPRDYRRGIFKFTSTKPTVRASRDDLYRIVKMGVPGTYMPSFMLLPDEEAKALVEYVCWLSMRGEMEGKLVVELKNDFGKDVVGDRKLAELSQEFEAFRSAELPGKVLSSVGELKEDWEAANSEENVVVPAVERLPADAESVERGRKLFMGDKGKCFSCHGEHGRGNGVSTEDLNDIPGQPGKKSDRPGLFDVWGNIVKPRDLTSGIYRGGRRPLDIYRRISAGIKGTPMQAFGTTLKDEEIWDLTNYVLSVPFEKKLRTSAH